MIHLFKHEKGSLKDKFDIALVVKGRFIFGSNQGYERRDAAINAIRSVLHSVGFGIPKHDVIYFQDDTQENPLILYVSIGDRKITMASKQKVSKKYFPKGKSKKK